jgi:hypothetical protein
MPHDPYTRFGLSLKIPTGWAEFPVPYTVLHLHERCNCGEPTCGMILRQKRGHIMLVMDIGDLYETTWWLSVN